MARVAPAAVAAGAIVMLGLADGGYFASSWPPAIVALAAVAGLALVLGGRPPTGVFDLLLVGGLAAFAAWQAVSALWSLEPQDSLREAERGALYAAAALALLAVARAAGGRGLLAGVALGAGAVGAYSLGRRAALGAEDVPFQGTVLNEPLGYANALGALAALALVVAIGLATERPSPLRLGGLAAVFAISVAVLGLTSSRGSWLAATVGVATVAVFLATRATSARVAWLALQALLVAAVVASPLVANPTTLERGLSDRPYYWWTAWQALDERPLLGSGAGTFDLLWAAGAPIPVSVADAHSLYLETLVELGPLGLVLLCAALLAPLAAAVRLDGRGAGAGIGAYAAFLVHAGFDWDWEMPAVTVAGLACGAALLAERKSAPEAASS